MKLTLAMNKVIDEAVQSLLDYKRLSPQDDHAQVDELIDSLVRTVRRLEEYGHLSCI